MYSKNVSIVCEYLAYSDPTQMLFKWLIINAILVLMSVSDENDKPVSGVRNTLRWPYLYLAWIFEWSKL